MRASTFMFATVLHDEGFDQVLSNVAERAGLDAVTLASQYHHTRDIFPHKPVRKVRFLEEGAGFFQPAPTRYAGREIPPHVSQVAQEVDILGRLMTEAERRGLAVRAWTVFLHNTTLGSRSPDCTPRNTFGDPGVTNLSPANPDVRAYNPALAADIARDGVESILAETMSYQGFDHGYHHERSFVPLTPMARFLLGLCFCPHCLAYAKDHEVDGTRVREFVRGELERLLNGEPSVADADAVNRDVLDTAIDGELGRSLAVRQAIITSLNAEVAEAVAAVGSTNYTFMGNVDVGAPGDSPAPASGWVTGADMPALARSVQALQAIGYARDPEEVRRIVARFEELPMEGKPLSVAKRPMLPDCDSPENLAAKVARWASTGSTSTTTASFG